MPQQETILFASPVDDASAWEKALRAELPDASFRVYPDIPEPAAVTTALVWKPPHGLFAPLINLRLVVNLGAGVDSLLGRDDLPDVPITRLSDPGMISLMVSYVLFAVIRYARDIDKFEEAQARGEWRYIHPRSLATVKVGVLGLGELGAPAASALTGLGFDVRGWSRSPKDVPGVVCCHGINALDALLGEVEILVVMLPLTPETHGLVNSHRLRRLRPGTKLINASRGAVVDEEELIAALSDGHLGGATLDVFVTEPLPPSSPLWRMPNVMITPHLASITVPESAARDVAESIRRVRQGEPPLHVVDPRRGY
jgi:glyoxylate/hydroxypyruvate reductase A